MRPTRLFVTRWMLAFFVAMTVAATASAASPAHAGPRAAKGLELTGEMKHADGPGHGRQGDPGFHGNGADGVSVDVFFNDYRRDIIRDYYRDAFRTGHCPPGLAKKHNGCMPPGQAKKWRLGYPLPDGVIYYGLPDDLVVRLGYDNPAYKLIRVGG